MVEFDDSMFAKAGTPEEEKARSEALERVKQAAHEAALDAIKKATLEHADTYKALAGDSDAITKMEQAKEGK